MVTEQDQGIWRKDGEAIAAGAPVLVNPVVATGEHHSRVAEHPEGTDWQGEWYSSGSTFFLRHIRIHGDHRLDHHVTEPEHEVRQALQDENAEPEIAFLQNDKMQIWGGDLIWSYGVSKMKEDIIAGCGKHVLAFDWFASDGKTTMRGIHNINLPWGQVLQVEQELRSLLLDNSPPASTKAN